MPDSNYSNRRDFLTGKSITQAVQSAVEKTEFAADDAKYNALSTARQENYLEQYSKNAMACEFELFFNLHQYRQAGSAAAEAFGLIDRLEDQMTVYRSESEISQLNESAHRLPVCVESGLFELLQLAVRLYRETGGAFDMTSGQLTKLWQFDRRAGKMPSPEQIESTLRRVGSEQIELNPVQQTVFFQQQGVSINLGGIGKGYAIDQVAQLLLDAGIEDFTIHGGQSSVLARGGSKLTSENGGETNDSVSWTIGISHPVLPAVRLAEVHLHNQALGTSGTARQGFFFQGKRYGHIIDPRTGWPANHILSSTVITDSAARADALATAFFVMTVEQIADYCQQHPEVAAVLIRFPEPPKQAGNAKVAITTFNVDDRMLTFCQS